MRFSASSLLALYGLLSASVLTVAQPNDTDFMSVRADVAKDYESEGEIPTEKYFSKPHSFRLDPSQPPGLGNGGAGPSGPLSIDLLTDFFSTLAESSYVYPSNTITVDQY
jgi:hypothetical protein